MRKTLLFPDPVEKEEPKPQIPFFLMDQNTHEIPSVKPPIEEPPTIPENPIDDLHLPGDITANNASLMGDLVATNGHFTNNIQCDGEIGCHNLKMEKLSIPLVNTTTIISQSGLQLNVAPNFYISIPNIKHQIVILELPEINPPLIKSAKIFIVTRNVLLKADETCDGIEIMVYNNSAINILVRDLLNVLAKVHPNCLVKLVYLHLVAQWVVC